MLRTNDLPPVRVPLQLLSDGKPKIEPGFSVLAIGATQILGGGVIEGIPQDEVHCAIVDCWGVSDLTEGHWLALTSAGGVRLHVVPAPINEALRSTLERFHADGIRRIEGEAARRNGALDAVRALGEIFPAATLGAAAMAARNGGQRGPGRQ
jgi:hypothetical protein